MPLVQRGKLITGNDWLSADSASTPPIDGESGTFAGQAQLGMLLGDGLAGSAYVNAGTAEHPIWTPIEGPSQGILTAFAVDENFATLDNWILEAHATVATGRYASTVGGTNADAILPIYGGANAQGGRFSFAVKATKSTASSRSTVGFTTGGTPGTLPAGGAFLFGVGYNQGTGLCFVRDNVGADVVILADASLVDGSDYYVTCWWENELGTSGNINKLWARVTDASGARIAGSVGATMNPASFTVTNLLLRTNVASPGAIRDLRYVGHAAGSLGMRGRATYATILDATDATEDCFIRIPARPLLPPRYVICCHGHGASPTSFAETDATVRPMFEALERAGYIVIAPRMGGTALNLWGNSVALGYVVARYRQLRAAWGGDAHVFLFGTSMGGGAAAGLICRGVLPVRAAYLAQPAVNYEWVSGQAALNTILSAYPDAATRDQFDPMKYPATAFQGVPIYVKASPSDTTVRKVENADRLVTKLGSQVTLVAATGNHNDASHYDPAALIGFFNQFAV